MMNDLLREIAANQDRMAIESGFRALHMNRKALDAAFLHLALGYMSDATTDPDGAVVSGPSHVKSLQRLAILSEVEAQIHNTIAGYLEEDRRAEAHTMAAQNQGGRSQ